MAPNRSSQRSRRDSSANRTSRVLSPASVPSCSRSGDTAIGRAKPLVAPGLGARQLVLLTDVDGVRDADGRRLDALTAGEAETLIGSGVIAGGMVPKVQAALGALGWDGAEAIIADSAAPNALARALTDPTFGTGITAGRAARVGAA